MLDIETRGQAYISLSQLLQRPDKESRQLVCSPEFKSLWQKIEASYNLQFPESWEIEALPDLKEWDRLWKMTMGPIKPLAEPIESLYKVWTTDPSCEMPMANLKGYLKSDWACHMEELLTKSGVEIPEQFAYCPDHLVLEFEFFSLLIEEATLEAQLMFAEHHFDWLKDLLETAIEKNAPVLYQDLYNFCLEYVKADIRSLL